MNREIKKYCLWKGENNIKYILKLGEKKTVWTYIKSIFTSEKNWNWYGLSANPNITWETVRDKPWNWDYLSKNPIITWEIVQDNPDKPWDWKWLSENLNITLEIIKNNTHIPWSWCYLSANPNITWEIVRDNSDKSWNWGNLSRNKFLYDPIVNKKYRSNDIKWRQRYLKSVLEKISSFSKKIDKIIHKRLNYT